MDTISLYTLVTPEVLKKVLLTGSESFGRYLSHHLEDTVKRRV